MGVLGELDMAPTVSRTANMARWEIMILYKKRNNSCLKAFPPEISIIQEMFIKQTGHLIKVLYLQSFPKLIETIFICMTSSSCKSCGPSVGDQGEKH